MRLFQVFDRQSNPFLKINFQIFYDKTIKPYLFHQQHEAHHRRYVSQLLHASFCAK
jgi:hypothetical protein